LAKRSLVADRLGARRMPRKDPIGRSGVED
jgi:hypothetical protein